MRKRKNRLSRGSSFPCLRGRPRIAGSIWTHFGWTLLCSTGVKVWGWLQGESWLYVANVGDSRAVKQPSILRHAVVICHNLLQPSRNILMCNDMSNDPFWNQGFTIAWLAAPHQKRKPTGPFTSFSLWSSPFRTIWGSGLSNGRRPLRNLGLLLSVKSHQIIPLRGIVWCNIQSYEFIWVILYVIDVIDAIDVILCVSAASRGQPADAGSPSRRLGRSGTDPIRRRWGPPAETWERHLAHLCARRIGEAKPQPCLISSL